jgi:hypothetical protein
MLIDSTDKSSDLPAASSAPSHRRQLPRYALAGVGILVVGEILMLMRVSLVTQWFTPIMWTGYILLVDGVIRKRKGVSLFSSYPLEFTLLALISIFSWVIFEGYNMLLKNWTYIELPDNMIVRYIGYAWAFATISPAMFVT